MHCRAIFALLLLTFSLAGAQDIPTYTVSYGDITFSFRGTVATGVDVAEEADGVNVSPFAMFPAESPAHTLFTLTGYVPNPAEDLNRDRFHAPEIRVYRIEDVMSGALDDATYASEVELLRELLETRPALDTLEHLPFLPLIPGVQTLHTRGHYLENDSIFGIAYLTHRADRAGLILEGRVLHTFQGISKDGRYYIASWLSVDSGVLPVEFSYKSDVDAIMENYDLYRNARIIALNDQPADAFYPPLPDLDAIFESFAISD